MRNTVLSIFPGIDLLGRGFELEGFCVVRGPDLLFGGDIRRFKVEPGIFVGVVGGSPCQEFSSLFRGEVTGYGLEMLAEFGRCVVEANPDWFLLENVPRVPCLDVAGYFVQRFDLSAAECGLKQRRVRHFQFGSRDGVPLVLRRSVTVQGLEGAAVASEGKWPSRGFGRFCELQGLPADFDLPGFTKEARYRAVGNGVPVPMARLVAGAIRERRPFDGRLCACGCGRPVSGKELSAGAACRKRLERGRRGVSVTGRRVSVTGPGMPAVLVSQSD